MAALEILALDEATPQIVAPQTGDTYTLPRKAAITPEANTNALAVTGFSLTGSNAQSMFDLAGTWNTFGTPTALKMNVTDTSSNAASLLMDLQVGGVSKFKIEKGGSTWLGGSGADWKIDTSNAGLIGVNRNGVSFVFGINWSDEMVLSSGMKLGFASGNASSALDTILARDAANTLALRNSTNAQAFNVYNTYTNASNYERGFFKWNSNVLEIGTGKSGTGTGQALKLIPSANTLGDDLTLQGGTYVLRLDTTYAFNFATTGQADGGVYVCGDSSSGNARATFIGREKLEFQRDCVSPSLSQKVQSSDLATAALSIFAQAALPAATTNLVGGGLAVTGGAGASSSAGNAHGGNVTIRGGTGYGTGHDGYIIMDNLPTADPSVSGALWSNSGVLTVSA